MMRSKQPQAKTEREDKEINLTLGAAILAWLVFFLVAGYGFGSLISQLFRWLMAGR